MNIYLKTVTRFAKYLCCPKYSNEVQSSAILSNQIGHGNIQISTGYILLTLV